MSQNDDRSSYETKGNARLALEDDSLGDLDRRLPDPADDAEHRNVGAGLSADRRDPRTASRYSDR